VADQSGVEPLASAVQTPRPVSWQTPASVAERPSERSAQGWGMGKWWRELSIGVLLARWAFAQERA